MQWEYYIYHTTYAPNMSKVITDIAMLGLDGWELIIVIQDNLTHKFYYHFKRPKPNPVSDSI